MNRLLNILLVCLLQVSWAVASTYNLKVEVTPNGAGSLNTSGGNYEEGNSIRLYTSNYTGFVFLGWYDGETLLSSSQSFYYTMPAKDVTVHAKYEYDPSVPANPDPMPVRYTLNIQCKPAGSGSFNTSNTIVGEGENTRLYAYTNTGFKFLRWEDKDGNTLSSEQNFYYVMPHGNQTIYGIFEYDPEPPSNPLKNYWNSETGEVIVDDFKQNSLSSAISDAIGNSSRNDVSMITVAGMIGDYDFGIANSFSNCILLDLSRTTGVAQIPSYAFDYTNLESVYLPATVEKIGARAFAECSKLSSLTVHAMTPPALESNVFRGVQEGLVVYVPAAAIAQYRDMDGWKNFTLLPIQEDIRSLSVSLPVGVDAADYDKMWLELTNTKSGQRMHYVMTDRNSYTFANIIRNTSWNVMLRNERGDVFGQIDNVEVKDEDVSVTFASLAKPQNVSVSVVTPDGKNVTSQTQVTWTDKAGNYLAQSYSFKGLLPETELAYRVTLSQELAMQYSVPASAEYIVSADGNDVKCQLEAIKQVQLTGKVNDVATKSALSGATVSASQTFGGKYSKTVSTKTDANGNYTLTVSNVPTSLAIAASDYISQSVVCDTLMTGAETVAVPDVSLKSITGAVISLGFTYTSSVAADSEADTQNWYSDCNNVAYTIYNKTKQQNISQFNVQYPQIVLLEEVEEGDVLELTATSKTSAFMPVATTATVDAEQRANATFDIVELGKIQATFAKNGNASVVGSLYDANGKLLKSYDYRNASLTISDLADGNYTLVSMGSSRLFNTIYDLSQLPQTGLVSGSDYAQNTVEVKSGVVSVINIDEVPTLDESKLYYTGDNTSFTVNKSSIVAGNYLTLTGHLDFKSAYATNVSNVNLIVDLPESCSFVENSVMVGNSTNSYTLNGTRLTIPMARYTDRVRFCVIPTLGGEYAPSAFAQFDLNDETVTQPIGSASYTAKDLSISVPSTVAKTTIPVSGTAIGKCVIEIYDNDVLIGQTTSLANGTWATTCELNNPQNLSNHQIYAKVITKNRLDLLTETQQLRYDENAIEISAVHMYHWNPEQRITYDIVFDYQKPSTIAQKYIYYIYNKQFTFTIDFTDNDTTKIHDVKLRVKTGNGTWTILPTTFDNNKKCWIASGEFGNMYDGNIPKNVSVSYTNLTTPIVSMSDFRDCLNGNEERQLKEELNYINELFEKENTDIYEEINSILSSVVGEIEYNDELDIENLSEEEIYALLDESIEKLTSYDFSDYLIPVDYNAESFTFAGISISRESLDGITEKTLLDLGYSKMSVTDGSSVYVYRDADTFCIADFSTGMYLKAKSIDDFLKIMKAKDVSIGDAGLLLEQWTSTLFDVFDKGVDKIIAFNKDLKKADRILKMCKTRGFVKGAEKWAANKIAIDNAIKGVGISATQIKYLRPIAKTIPFVDWGIIFYQEIEKLAEVDRLVKQIPVACTDSKKLVELANEITKEADEIKTKITDYYVSSFILSKGVGGLVAAAGAAFPPSLIVSLPALIYGQYKFDNLFDEHCKNSINELKSHIHRLHIECNLDVPDNGDWHDSQNPDNNVGIDPSGYVYEGVSSNRIEGVTATVFYKETVEDIYGDLHENIVKWDASEFAQENPLFTDNEGMYRWDVPQGLWQVKFEKEGYQTTYSDWLPVPPPQLDINIPMTQTRQPVIKSARAFEDGVEVEFDKYMMPELLTTDNIVVMQNGKQVDGTIKLLNEEVSYEGASETFASKLRFVAAAPFTESEITLSVYNKVKSYAGVRMQDNYMQTFGVEQEIKQIECDSLATVVYGENAVFTVRVLPVSAAAGKILRVVPSSMMTLNISSETVILDSEGKAEITVGGNLPGTAAVTYEVDGYDLSAMTIVKVETAAARITAKPTSKIASGSMVDKGTKIYLYCATKDATIYYTLDGSCPCDDTAARKVYDGTPIVVNESVTIRAMAVAPDMYESEVAAFSYIVDETGIDDVTMNASIEIFPLPVRKTLNVTAGGRIIKSVVVSSINGIVVASSVNAATKVTLDVSKIPAGIYIINVTTENGVYSRKIHKVQ